MQCSRSLLGLASDLLVTVATWNCGSDSSKRLNYLAPWENYLACFWCCTITTGDPLQVFGFSVTHCRLLASRRSV